MADLHNLLVKRRLDEIKKDNKIKSDRAFALSLGTDPSFYGKILKGDRPFPQSIIEALKEKYAVNETWLQHGTGSKYSANAPHKSVDASGRTGPTRKNESSSLVFMEGKTEATYLKEYLEVMKTRLSDLEEDKKFLQRMMEANLISISNSQTVVLAYQKAWVEWMAEREAGADKKKKLALMDRMGRLIAEKLGVPEQKDKGVLAGT